MRINFGLRHEFTSFKAGLEFKGSGTIEDPYIITPILKLSWKLYSISLSNSNSYAQFTNYKTYEEAPFLYEDSPLFRKPYTTKFKPKFLRVENCSHLTIFNSFFNKVKIIESSDILIQNVTINRYLKVLSSNNIKIQDSNIKKISKKTNLNSIQYLD